MFGLHQREDRQDRRGGRAARGVAGNQLHRLAQQPDRRFRIAVAPGRKGLDEGDPADTRPVVGQQRGGPGRAQRVETDGPDLDAGTQPDRQPLRPVHQRLRARAACEQGAEQTAALVGIVPDPPEPQVEHRRQQRVRLLRRRRGSAQHREQVRPLVLHQLDGLGLGAAVPQAPGRRGDPDHVPGQPVPGRRRPARLGQPLAGELRREPRHPEPRGAHPGGVAQRDQHPGRDQPHQACRHLLRVDAPARAQGRGRLLGEGPREHPDAAPDDPVARVALRLHRAQRPAQRPVPGEVGRRVAESESAALAQPLRQFDRLQAVQLPRRVGERQRQTVQGRADLHEGGRGRRVEHQPGPDRARVFEQQPHRGRAEPGPHGQRRQPQHALVPEPERSPRRHHHAQDRAAPQQQRHQPQRARLDGVHVVQQQHRLAVLRLGDGLGERVECGADLTGRVELGLAAEHREHGRHEPLRGGPAATGGRSGNARPRSAGPEGGELRHADEEQRGRRHPGAGAQCGHGQQALADPDRSGDRHQPVAAEQPVQQRGLALPPDQRPRGARLGPRPVRARCPVPGHPRHPSRPPFPVSPRADAGGGAR